MTKSYFAWAWIVCVLFVSAVAGAAPRVIDADVVRGVSSVRNYIKNPYCERNTQGISTLGSTISQDVSPAADQLDDIASCSCSDGGTNSYCEWDAYAPAQGDQTGNCQMDFTYKGTTGGLWKGVVYDSGGNAIAETAVLGDASDWTDKTLIVPCASTARKFQMRRTSDSGSPGAPNVGRIRYGKARDIANVTPAGPWQSWTPTGSWTTNTTYTGRWRQVGEEGEYEVYIALAGAPASGNLTINLPTGHVIDTTKRAKGTGNNGGMRLSGGQILDNGVAVWPAHVDYSTTTSVLVQSVVNSGDPRISSAVTTSAPFSFGNLDSVTVRWSAPIVGWSAQSAVRLDQTANSWSGYHGSDCSWARTNTAFGDPTADASCTFTERTNVSFGTVTSYLSGSDKLPGIVFTPSRAQKYFVCARIVQTISAAGAGSAVRLTDGSTVIADNAATSGASYGTALSLCGIYNATSIAAKTLRVETQAVSTFTITITGNAAAGGTFNAVEWSIFGLDQSFPSPLVLNGVTCGYNGVCPIEFGYVGGASDNSSCTGTCTVYRGTSGITGATRSGTGVYAVGVSGFSSAPVCQITNANSGNNCFRITSTSTSSIGVASGSCNASGGGSADAGFNITCFGFK